MVRAGSLATPVAGSLGEPQNEVGPDDQLPIRIMDVLPENYVPSDFC